MELTFLGGASEVGGSSMLLHVAGHCLLIDGGMRPAAHDGQSRIPDLALLDQFPPEALIITHAHIDHTGALPLIASLYPHIPIYATESTKIITEILLRDSVRIMDQEGLKLDGETPLYNVEQVDALLGRIQSLGFKQSFTPIPAIPEIRTWYLPAGHILGAGMLYFSTPEGTLLHTGDISVTDQRTIKGLDVSSLPHADIMVCEGTYGNRMHTSRKEEERKFAEAVQATLARNGRVLCPAFAVGRAQEIVLILKSYRASGYISPVPIYLDGMVRSVCTAYQSQAHDLHPNLQRYLKNARRPLFVDPGLHIFAVRAHERATLVARQEPAIIISSSGMLTGGASPLYGVHIAAREQDALLLTGYQDEESPGAALLRARPGLPLHIGSKTVTLACQVEKYNLSGHADSEQICQVVTKVAPHRLVLVHGAPEALAALKQRFVDVHVDIPIVGTTLTFQNQQLLSASLSTVLVDESILLPTEHEELPAVSLPAPGVEALWLLAKRLGPQRPWTIVELGQAYYGSTYRPSLRPAIEQIFKNDTSSYFKRNRIGAQAIYQPCETVLGRSLNGMASHLGMSEPPQTFPLSLDKSTINLPQSGEVVLVQGQKNAPPYLGLTLSGAYNGSIRIVTDGWKAGVRPLSMLQLLPGILRSDWLQSSDEINKIALKQWRTQLESSWTDLFFWWKNSQMQAFTFASLCHDLRLTTDDARLAWGLELLLHGSLLFRRDGELWTPFSAQRIEGNDGFTQHLRLLDAGVGAQVQINGRPATLTGHSNWRLFEAQWCEFAPELESELVQVRASTVRLV